MWPLIGLGISSVLSIFSRPKQPSQTTIDVVAKMQGDLQSELLKYYYIPAALVGVGAMMLLFGGRSK